MNNALKNTQRVHDEHAVEKQKKLKQDDGVSDQSVNQSRTTEDDSECVAYQVKVHEKVTPPAQGQQRRLQELERPRTLRLSGESNAHNSCLAQKVLLGPRGTTTQPLRAPHDSRRGVRPQEARDGCHTRSRAR